VGWENYADPVGIITAATPRARSTKLLLCRLANRVAYQCLSKRPNRAWHLVAVRDNEVESFLDPVTVLVSDRQRRQQLDCAAAMAGNLVQNFMVLGQRHGEELAEAASKVDVVRQGQNAVRGPAISVTAIDVTRPAGRAACKFDGSLNTFCAGIGEKHFVEKRNVLEQQSASKMISCLTDTTESLIECLVEYVKGFLTRVHPLDSAIGRGAPRAPGRDDGRPPHERIFWPADQSTRPPVMPAGRAGHPFLGPRPDVAS
jgi:hypothetical protein